MSLDISVGFNARPEAGYTGFENGGIRISVDEIQVIVLPNGKIETAFPISGPAVKKWISQLNGGQGEGIC
jgi:hypothetical protein